MLKKPTALLLLDIPVNIFCWKNIVFEGLAGGFELPIYKVVQVPKFRFRALILRH